MTAAALLVRSGLSAEETATVATQPPAATATVATTTDPDATPTTPTTTEPPEGAQFYTIQSGDTLESIAADHGTTVEVLLELNPEVDPVALTVGQRIRIA